MLWTCFGAGMGHAHCPLYLVHTYTLFLNVLRHHSSSVPNNGCRREWQIARFRSCSCDALLAERREGALSRETSMGQDGSRLRGATAERSRLGQASSSAARAFSPTLGTPRGRRWGRAVRQRSY